MYDLKRFDFTSYFNKLNMDISEAKAVLLDSKWQCENVCSVFTRIYMIEEGEGEIVCENETLSLLPGNIYLIPAGLNFSYRCEEYLKKIYFHVSVLLPNHKDLFTKCHECIVFEHQGETIETMRKSLSENKPFGVMNAKMILEQLMLRCLTFRQDLNQEIGSYSETLQKAQEYIAANLSAKLTVSQVADALFLSPSKLQKLFKSELKVSVGRYIREQLMYLAEREVRRGEYSISELSNRLGFCDQFYFSRCFSETYGVAPLRYRKRFSV